MRHPLTFLFLFFSLHSFAKTYYVNKSAVGANDGSSWVNAFTQLQSALGEARSGDSIKVASGIYSPSSVPYNGSTFFMGRGVILLGGYPGLGSPSDAQRNWVNQPTILSNSGYSALLMSATNIDTATVIDGFQITAGIGGIQIENCSQLAIANTIFQNNNNGAVTIDKSQVIFTNCVFDHNSGGNATIDQTGSSSSIFYNCVLSANQPSYSNATIRNQDASISLINCSIVNNSGIGLYGAGSGTATIKNSIFWNNVTNYTTEGADIQPGNQTVVIGNSLTQTYYQDGVNTLLVNYNPRFYNIGNPAGMDNTWFTADDGLQLTAPCSPALNSGDNSAVTIITSDMVGKARRFNGGTVDLGAYELQSTPGTPATTVFVNSRATGSGNGSSWTNAFKNLQQALLYCADTIKMAAGVYLTDNSLKDSIFFLQNKTVILGGYPATGNPLDVQRDPALNQTLLKGNYQFPNSGIHYPVLQSFHCDSSTLIDGLAFDNESNESDGSVPSLYIGYESKLRVANCQFLVVNNNNQGGGGILITQYSSPSISRSSFNTDMSTYSGGAITCQSNSSPVIRYCQFTGNTNAGPTFRGTGYAISFGQSTGIVDSCVFSRNSSNAVGSTVILSASNIQLTNSVFSASNSGGNLLSSYNNSSGNINNCVFKNIGSLAVYNSNSSPVFNQCLFDGNSVAVQNTNHAAPVFNNCVSLNSTFMQNTKSSPQVNNCTVVNTASNNFTPNPSETELITNNDSSTLRANNTIFWGNKLAQGHKDIGDSPAYNYIQSSTSILTNCITRNYGKNGANGNKVGINPRFFRLTDLYGPDKIIFTADDGIRLAKCSPAIDAGNNALGTELPKDILGSPRIFNGTVDIGAYESQQARATSNSYYVNANASGNNTGTSWQNAYTNLQMAICDICSDTLRVAAGIYKPAVSNRDSSFDFQRAMTLYGGYPAAGPAGEAQRDPFTNLTVLSGNIGDPADSADNSKTIITIESVPDSITIDGFAIRDGYSITGGFGASIGNPGGAAISMYYSKAIIRNCQFVHNQSSFSGGAINVGYLDTCIVNRSVFSYNSATNSGGAIADTYGYLDLNGCIFDHNHAYGQGGALQLYISFNLKNCLFYKNYTTATTAFGTGGAIDASSGSGTISNCTLVGNSSAYLGAAGGGIFYSQSRRVPIKNCIFKDNMAGGSSTGGYADIDWEDYGILINSLLQANRPYYGAYNRYGANPDFIDEAHPQGKDGKWFTADDGLQLTYGSPAIDYGDSIAVASITSDLAGGKRIVGATVDAGAYEFQDQPLALAGKDTLICSSDSIRIGRGGDPAFTYKWTSNPTGFVSKAPIATIRPTAATSYYLNVTDGTTISTDTVDVTTTSSAIPTIAIYADTTAICQGSNVVFNTVAANGGDSTIYQWLVNDVNVGTNSNKFSSSTLADGSKVAVVMKSSISCAIPKAVTSNSITMKVAPVVHPSVTIAALQDLVCVGTNATLKVTPVNGGDHPSFTWYIGGRTYQTTADSLVAYFVDTLTGAMAVMTSSDGCASQKAYSNDIKVRASLHETLSVTIAASQTSICKGDSVLFTATSVYSDKSIGYQWRIGGLIAETKNNTYNSKTLRNGDVVTATVLSYSSCVSPQSATSNSVPISVTVNTPLISISASAPAGQGQPVVLTATTSNGGPSPGFQWQERTGAVGWQDIATAAATTSILSYIPPATGADIRCLLTSSLDCVTERTVASAPLVFAATGTTSTPATSDSGNSVRLYPNPVYSILTVDSMKISDRWETVEVRGSGGQQRILSVNATGRIQVTIDMGALPGGVYVICLLRRTGTNIYRKILKL